MGDDAFRSAPIPLAREQQVHLAIAPDQAELPNPLERLFSNGSTWRSLPARGGGSERIRDRRHVGAEGPTTESRLVVSDPGKPRRPVSHPESRSGDMRHDHLHRMPGSSRFAHSRFVNSRFAHRRRRPVRNAQPSPLFTLENARSSPRLTRDSQVRWRRPPSIARSPFAIQALNRAKSTIRGKIGPPHAPNERFRIICTEHNQS